MVGDRKRRPYVCRTPRGYRVRSELGNGAGDQGQTRFPVYSGDQGQTRFPVYLISASRGDQGQTRFPVYLISASRGRPRGDQGQGRPGSGRPGETRVTGRPQGDQGQTRFPVYLISASGPNSPSSTSSRRRTSFRSTRHLANRFVRFGTLSGRHTPSTCASSVCVATVYLRAYGDQGQTRFPVYLISASGPNSPSNTSSRRWTSFRSTSHLANRFVRFGTLSGRHTETRVRPYGDHTETRVRPGFRFI
jgi:hypothetical protein